MPGVAWKLVTAVRGRGQCWEGKDPKKPGKGFWAGLCDKLGRGGNSRCGLIQQPQGLNVNCGSKNAGAARDPGRNSRKGCLPGSVVGGSGVEPSLRRSQGLQGSEHVMVVGLAMEVHPMVVRLVMEAGLVVVRLIWRLV